jgi:hypothetical protein
VASIIAAALRIEEEIIRASRRDSVVNLALICETSSASYCELAWVVTLLDKSDEISCEENAPLTISPTQFNRDDTE